MPFAPPAPESLIEGDEKAFAPPAPESLIKESEPTPKPVFRPTDFRVSQAARQIAQAQADPTEREPLLQIMRPRPGYEEQVVASGTPEEKRLLGYQKGVADTINSLTSPQSLKLIALTAGAGGVAKVLPRLIGLAFAAHMGKEVAVDIPNQLAIEYSKPPEKRDEVRIGQLISQGLSEAGLAGLIGAESVKPSTKGVTDASQVRETTEIHGDVRPRPEQSVQKVPIEESGPGVQPQTAESLPETIAKVEPGEPQAQQSTAEVPVTLKDRLQRAWDDHENQYDTGEIVTVEDLVDQVEGILNDTEEPPPKLQKAVDKFRKEQEDDFKLGGRGDMDLAREKFTDSLERELGKLGKANLEKPALDVQDVGFDLPYVEPPYRPINASEASSPTDLARFATKDSRIGETTTGKRTRKATETNRLLVLQDKQDGSVHVVSVYQHPSRGPYAVDPRLAGQKSPNRSLSSLLERYTPLYSVLRSEKVQNFHHAYQSLAEYQAQFGDAASQAMQQRAAVPPTQTSEPVEARQLEAPTDAELSQTYSILKPVSGNVTPESLARTLNTVAQSGKGTVGQRQALSAIAKLAQRIIDRENKSPEDALAQAIEQLHETAKTSADPAAFQKSILSGFTEGTGQGAKTAAPTAPQASVRLTSSERPSANALGVIAPSAPLNATAAQAMAAPMESLAKGLRDFWHSFSLQSAPRTTSANRLVGEAAVRFGAAPNVARIKGLIFAERVKQDLGGRDFDRKLGTALTEDNLRSIRQAYEEAGDTEGASTVSTVIGAENSPFKTEAEYQAFLAEPETVEAINRHKQLWEQEKDPIYRKANDLDPDAELETRGQQTGARINLKAVVPGEGTRTTVGPASRRGLIRQTATLLRRDPFARKAKGTGQSYEGSYQEIMANAYEREYPVAAQHEYIKSLLDSGLGKITDQEFPKGLEIHGEQPKAYLMRLNPWRGKFLQLPKSIASEYEVITGLAPSSRIPYWTKAGEFLTKQSVQGFAEGSTHVANIFQKTFLGLGPTSNPLLNALLKVAGRSDMLVTLPRVVIKAFGDRRQDMLKLAEINAAKNPYGGPIGWIINRVDQGVRLNSASVYDGLAEAGWVPKTETGKREFINQVGNYNKRLQPSVIRWLRDTNVQPFATAHQTFLTMGLREMTLGPGAKATSLPAAFALRVEKAAGIMGLVAIVGTLNCILSGNASGPKGTELGAVGWIGDDKKLHQFNIAKLTGMDRGLRQTGIKGAIEAKRLGLPLSSQLKAGVGGAASTAVQTVSGPMVQFAAKAATGYRPGVPMVREAPVAPPQGDSLNPLKTQMAENIKTALVQANPIVDSIVSRAQGKGADEILQQQFSRFTPRTGLSQETIAALPRIVESQNIKEYSAYLATLARKQPMAKRQSFVMEQMRKDGARAQDKPRIFEEVKRHGIFKYN